jgi:hypothetical protein
MAESNRPSPEEIILYAKDPETKIATITFNRPEFLNAPTSAVSTSPTWTTSGGGGPLSSTHATGVIGHAHGGARTAARQ